MSLQHLCAALAAVLLSAGCAAAPTPTFTPRITLYPTDAPVAPTPAPTRTPRPSVRARLTPGVMPTRRPPGNAAPGLVPTRVPPTVEHKPGQRYYILVCGSATHCPALPPGYARVPLSPIAAHFGANAMYAEGEVYIGEDGLFSQTRAIADMLDRIDDPSASFYLIGHSLGANTIVEAAGLTGDPRIKGLVLLDAQLVDDPSYSDSVASASVLGDSIDMFVAHTTDPDNWRGTPEGAHVTFASSPFDVSHYELSYYQPAMDQVIAWLEQH